MVHCAHGHLSTHVMCRTLDTDPSALGVTPTTQDVSYTQTRPPVPVRPSRYHQSVTPSPSDHVPFGGAQETGPGRTVRPGHPEG